MSIPESEDIPERYRFRTDGPAFEIGIRESLAPSVDAWPADYENRYVLKAAGEASASKDEPYELVLPTDESGEFGFEGAFHRVDSVDGWVTFRSVLPALDEQSNHAEHRAFMAFCGTVEFAFRQLSHYADIEDGGPEPQRLFLMLSYDARRHFNGPAMDVRITPRLARWVNATLERDHAAELDEVTEAMRAPLECGLRGYERSQEGGTYSTRVEFRQRGLVYMQVPGSATVLTPENLSTFEEGYQMMSSNCDSIPQQLSFVWGLAKLEEVSRRVGKPPPVE